MGYDHVPHGSRVEHIDSEILRDFYPIDGLTVCVGYNNMTTEQENSQSEGFQF